MWPARVATGLSARVGTAAHLGRTILEVVDPVGQWHHRHGGRLFHPGELSNCGADI